MPAWVGDRPDVNLAGRRRVVVYISRAEVRSDAKVGPPPAVGVSPFPVPQARTLPDEREGGHGESSTVVGEDPCRHDLVSLDVKTRDQDSARVRVEQTVGPEACHLLVGDWHDDSLGGVNLQLVDLLPSVIGTSDERGFMHALRVPAERYILSAS